MPNQTMHRMRTSKRTRTTRIDFTTGRQSFSDFFSPILVMTGDTSPNLTAHGV